jgi:hypothetical protein
MHYPRILYKLGTQWAVDGGMVDLLTVNNEAEQLAAEDAGWLETASQAVQHEPVADHGVVVPVAESLAPAPEAGDGGVAPTQADNIPAPDDPPTRGEMIAILERSGLDVDKRWGNKRLMDELEKLGASDAP